MEIKNVIDLFSTFQCLKSSIKEAPEWAIIERNYSGCYYEGDSPDNVLKYVVTDDSNKILEHNDVVYFKMYDNTIHKGVVEIIKDKIQIKTTKRNYNPFNCNFIYQYEENAN